MTERVEKGWRVECGFKKRKKRGCAADLPEEAKEVETTNTFQALNSLEEEQIKEGEIRKEVQKSVEMEQPVMVQIEEEGNYVSMLPEKPYEEVPSGASG